MHLIVAPQLSGGYQHNYPTKTVQAGHANEQSIYSLMSIARTISMFVVCSKLARLFREKNAGKRD